MCSDKSGWDINITEAEVVAIHQEFGHEYRFARVHSPVFVSRNPHVRENQIADHPASEFSDEAYHVALNSIPR